MNGFDIVIILIIVGFGLYGFWGGLAKRLSAIIGLVVASYVSTHYYTILAAILIGKFGWGENSANIVSLIIFLTVIGAVVSFVIGKVFDQFKSIPFVGFIDRMLGMFLALFAGILLSGLVIFVIEQFPFSEQVTGWVVGSAVAPLVIKVAGLLIPLIPDGLKAIESAVELIN